VENSTQTNATAKGNGSPVLRSVPIRSLRVGTVTDFDLYLPADAGKPAVLFREKNHPFTEQVRQRLEESRVERLCIDISQEETYCRYVEEHLDQILGDPELDLDQKSEILYSSVQNLMREVMTDSRSPAEVRRSKNVVSSTVKFMMRERTALESLLKVVSFDYYTYTHSVNVMVFSVALAQRAGVTSLMALREWGEGFLLHDIGKSRIDAAIVNCKGVFTDEQWRIMKMHPVFGVELLSETEGVSRAAIDIVRHHHEKLTGTGYPDGLDASAISQQARICAISDIFDALTTRRAYKEAVKSFEALKLMQVEMSGELDGDLFRLFVAMMGNPSGE